ncbi:MAG: myxosortase MrtC [Polyangiales bacterium]
MRAMSAGREVSVAFVAVTLAAVSSTVAGRAEWFEPYVHLVVAVVFLWTALHLAQRQPDGLARYGLHLGGVLEPAEPPPSSLWATLTDLAAALRRAAPLALREALFALGLAMVIFPPFTLGFYVWHAPQHAFHLRAPEDVGSYLLAQLSLVALPEEALFRGYFQGRLSEIFDRRMRVLGASVCVPALLSQAALFALIHFAVTVAPERLAVFFPALVFGWLRERRGGIGAAIVFHALCNLFADVLVESWV